MMAGLGAGIGGGKVSGGTAKGAADAGKAHKMAGPSTYWGSTELGVLVMLLAIAAVGLTFRRRRNLRRDSRGDFPREGFCCCDGCLDCRLASHIFVPWAARAGGL